MKQKIYTLFIGLVFLLVGTTALAQSVSGTVKSEDDGLGIPGVSVVIKGTSRATITDVDGNYSIISSKGETLVFSLVGYEKQELTYNDASTIPLIISLKGGNISLGEVVITDVLGISREKRQLGYSAQKIDGVELAEVNRENFIDALQGRVAGLTVNSTGGAPGASSQVILRAATSFSQDNQPLYIVDGVPINNRTFNQGALVSDRPNRDVDYSSPIADLNPNDIESVNVLKGPEASALYGFYGANGAIVITTKKGKAGPGKMTYSNNFGFSEVYRFPEVQTEYSQGSNGTGSLQFRRHFGPKYPAGTQLYDNIGTFFQTGTNANHNIAFEGGKDNTSYRVSAALTDNKGVIPTTGLKRYSLSTRGATKILDNKLDINGSVSFIKSENQKTPRGNNGLYLNLLAWPANDDVTNFLNADGSRRRLTTAGNDTEFDSPNFTIYKNQISDITDRAYGNLSATYNPAKWVNFTLRGGYDFATTEGNYYINPESTILPTADRGVVENYVNNARIINGTALLSLTQSYGKSNIGLRLGASLDEQKYNAVSGRGTQLVIPELNSINNTYPTTMRNKQTYSTKRSLGFFAEANYDYDRFLTLTASIRNDRTSTLVAPNNSFVYPGGSVSFAFSELLKNAKWLDFGKIRFSVAGSGRDVPPYSLKSDLAPQLTTGAGYALGFTGNNPDLKPEIITSYSFGTELNFLKNRIGLEMTYFNQINSNQIMRLVRLSYGTGYVLQNFNGGTSSAQGIEATLSVTPVKSKDFEWSSIFNFLSARTRIVDFPADIPEFYVSDTWLFGNVRASVFRNQNASDNYSMTTLAGYTYARNSKGQLLISPTSGLPLINNTFTKIGDRQPDYTLGIINKFRYKSLNLTIALDIRKGGDIYNGNALYLWTLGLHPNQKDRETPRVVEGVLNDGKQESESPTANTIQVTPYYNNDYYRLQYAEESFIEKNINWLRVKDVRLTWNLPQKWLKQSSVFKNAQIYAAGTDLLLITNYSGADPNVNGVTPGTGGAGGAGFDYGTLSTPRVLSFGLTVGF